MGDVMITPPDEEPVSVAELRSYLRDAPDADGVLSTFIQSAREYVEEFTGRIMVEQVREATLDAWPGAIGGDGLDWWDGVREGAIGGGDAPRFVELRRAPLISIESVSTFDAANDDSEWSAADYYADTSSTPGRLALSAGAMWPQPGRPVAGIAIRYRAGYGNAAAVPAALKTAILQLAAHWYENREAANGEDVKRVPMQASRILQKFRIAKL